MILLVSFPQKDLARKLRSAEALETSTKAITEDFLNHCLAGKIT